MVNMGNVWDRTTEFLSDNVAAFLPIVLLGMLARIRSTRCSPACPGAQCRGGRRVVAAHLADRPVGPAGDHRAGDRARWRAAIARHSGATGAFGRALPAMLLVSRYFSFLRFRSSARLPPTASISTAMSGGRAGRSVRRHRRFHLDLLAGACRGGVPVAIRLPLISPVVVAAGGGMGAFPRRGVDARHRVEIVGVRLLYGIVYLVASARRHIRRSGQSSALVAGPSSPFGYRQIG